MDSPIGEDDSNVGDRETQVAVVLSRRAISGPMDRTANQGSGHVRGFLLLQVGRESSIGFVYGMHHGFL